MCRWWAKETASSASPRADMRYDYELALQIGNKDALNFFLAQYPDGYYANLAKLQLAKIAAEEMRVAATENARLAQQEQMRLANEGAQQMQLAKAASDLKAAEEARIAAEKAKEAAQEQAAQAEQRRVTTDNAAAVKNVASVAPDRPQETKVDTKIAALPSPQVPAPPPQAELAKSVQTELRRVGCFTGSANGEWNAASRRSLELFNKHAGTRFDVKLASVDALDAIKLKPTRVCPLICEFGFKRYGDRCSKITCAAGSFVNDDNECEKRKVRQVPSARYAPSARHDRNELRQNPRPRPARSRKAVSHSCRFSCPEDFVLTLLQEVCPLLEDIAAKVENRTTLKISRKLIFGLFCRSSLFNATMEVRDRFWMKRYAPSCRRA